MANQSLGSFRVLARRIDSVLADVRAGTRLEADAAFARLCGEHPSAEILLTEGDVVLVSAGPSGRLLFQSASARGTTR